MARDAQDAQNSDEVEVMLVIIEHPDIDGGVLRLSSDRKDVITLDPYVLGTYSTWRSDDGARRAFIGVGLDILLPDERDGAEAQASLALEILDSDINRILRSTIRPATCHMAVVMASTPDRPEAEFSNLRMDGADMDSGIVSLTFSNRKLYDEPACKVRMTKARFPGLHR